MGLTFWSVARSVVRSPESVCIVLMDDLDCVTKVKNGRDIPRFAVCHLEPLRRGGPYWSCMSERRRSVDGLV